MTKRVVVVGAGIVGLWIAYELRRRELDVVVIDKAELGSGSSFGNAGWVIPARALPLPAPGLHWEGLKMMMQPDSPLYIKPTALPRLTGWFTQFLKYCNPEAYRRGCEATASLTRMAHAGYDQLVEDGLQFEMHHRGLLSVYLDEKAWEIGFKDHQTMAELGLGEPQRLSAQEVRAMEPELGPGVVGGVFIHEARHVDPGSVLRALADRLAADGVRLLFSTEVTGFERQGDRLTGVKTKTETVAADDVVIAAGAWAGELAKPLGYSLPMQAGKGYSLQFSTANPRLQTALFLADAKIACTPLHRGTRYAGTIEFSGINLHMERARIEALHRKIPEYLPNYDRGLEAVEWVGMRPVTPDGLPVIGPVPGFANAFIASGHSTAGLPLAPGTAKMIADYVTGNPPAGPNPFDPARWSP
ncbi:MAG TPA: FAD-dependent oxidoreductase [Limnochordales bacterium]|nr:FAD-dependent oxidoreductase [Limnochordales bacterium]